MSGIAKAVKKVFKGVVGVVKKVWKPLLIAAAIYFTGGMALGAMGALSAGGSALAGAGAGLSAAAGGIGIGAGAGITGAFAAGAGTAAAEAAGAGLLGAGLGAGAAEVGAGTLGAGEAVAGDLGLSAAGAGAAEGATMGGVGMLSSLGGDAAGAAATGGFETLGGNGLTSAVDNPGAYTYAGPEMTGPPSSLAGQPGPTSSLWDKSLSVAGQIMKTPGMPTLIGGILQGYEQSKAMDAQYKWMQDHAPGQVTGGAANAWKAPGGGSAFPMGQNLQPNTPMPTAGKLPALNPYTQGSPQMPGVPMPGYGQPGSNSARYPGYGTPGYGMQPPYSGGVMPQQEDDGGLLSQTPYMDSPYDQSYA